MFARKVLRLYERVVQLAASPLLRLRERLLFKREARLNERPVEYVFALSQIAALAPQSVLDVGPGMSAFPAVLATCGIRVTAVDEINGYWTGGLRNLHWRVHKRDITKADSSQTYDMVTCISVLEHIPDHMAAIRGMARSLRPGGHLVLTVPFGRGEYQPNVYALPDASYGGTQYICQSFSPAELEQWSEAGLVLRAAEYWEVFTGEYWASGDRLAPLVPSVEGEPCHLGCFLFEQQAEFRR